MTRGTHFWSDVGALEDIPRQGARRVATAAGEIAIFRTLDDRLFAVRNSCPHRHGPLSEGIVHGARVTCPLHNWVIDLESGEVVGPDQGCVPRHMVELRGGRIFLRQLAAVPTPVLEPAE